MAERLARGVLAVVAVLHAVMVCAQPVLIGAVLDGSAGALVAHRAVGGTLMLVAMSQVVAAVLAWRPGRRSAWLVPVAVLVLVAELVQLVAGYAAALSLHVPLGVGILVAQVGVAVYALRRAPTRVANSAQV